MTLNIQNITYNGNVVSYLQAPIACNGTYSSPSLPTCAGQPSANVWNNCVGAGQDANPAIQVLNTLTIYNVAKDLLLLCGKNYLPPSFGCPDVSCWYPSALMSFLESSPWQYIACITNASCPGASGCNPVVDTSVCSAVFNGSFNSSLQSTYNLYSTNPTSSDSDGFVSILLSILGSIEYDTAIISLMNDYGNLPYSYYIDTTYPCPTKTISTTTQRTSGAERNVLSFSENAQSILLTFMSLIGMSFNQNWMINYFFLGFLMYMISNILL